MLPRFPENGLPYSARVRKERATSVVYMRMLYLGCCCSASVLLLCCCAAAAATAPDAASRIVLFLLAALLYEYLVLL